MKKKIAAFCLVVFCFLTSTSCGGSSTGFTPSKNKSAPTHLTLALRDGIYADVLSGCLPEFEKENDVACDVYRMSEDELHSKVAQDASNENGAYDLCMVDGSWMEEYASKDVLVFLNEYGYELDEDIIPGTKAICYTGDNTCLAPYYGNVTVLFYNKDIVKRAGYEDKPISSMEDMLSICRFAQKTHNLGFMYRGDSENNTVVDFLPILLSYGGWVVDKDNHPTVDTPEFHRAMEMYMALIETGKPADRDELVIAVANNAAAMAVGWPGWYTPEKNSTADYIAMPGRASESEEAFNASVYGIWAIGIPKNSGHKELAVKLLSYLMDPDVQHETIFDGGVPCRYSSLKDPEVLEKFPQYEAVCKALESGVYRPIKENWPSFYTILGRHMNQIINGEVSIDDGLRKAQQELEGL